MQLIKKNTADEKITEMELLKRFEVEELEQRFEMGWIKGGSVGGEVGSDGKGKVTATLNF